MRGSKKRILQKCPDFGKAFEGEVWSVEELWGDPEKKEIIRYM